MFLPNVNNPYDNYYRRNLRFLLLLGLWPYQDKRERYMRILIVNVIILVIFVVEVHQLTLPSFKIKSDFKELQLFLFCLCSIFSYYSIIFKPDARKKLRERLVLDWMQVSCKEEFDIMTKYAKEGEQFSVVITIILYLFGIFLIAPSLLRVFLHVFRMKDDIKLTLPVPLKSIAFFEEHFYVTLSMEIIAMLTLVTIAIVLNTTFLVCIKHSCALLRVITFKIYQPFREVSKDVPYDWFDSKDHDAYDWIKEIVRRYQNAMDYIDLINSLSEKVYTLEVLIATLIIVFNFLSLLESYEMVQSKSLEYLYEMVLSGIYTGGSIMIVYVNCYIGQTLIDHGTDVLESFYQVSLYKLPLKCQRVLPIMIMRSTKPCVISIGGMFTASHDFFARFMNTSLSYAMVCYNMR